MVPRCHRNVLRFSCRTWSTVYDADLMRVATSLSCYSVGRFRNSSSCTMLARLRTRRVGSLREAVSRTSVGKWLNWVNIISTCVCAVNLLSMFVFIVRVRCSTPIWVALSLMEGISRQASISGRWTPSMGKFGRIPIACRMALLSMPYMVVNCRSLKTPRWVAWYFDFNKSC